MKRWIPLIAFAIGIGVAAYVIAGAGWSSVWHALLSSGWAVAAVAFLRAIVVAFAGIGWWRLYPKQYRPRIQTCVNVRFIREAINMLLPFTAVGGDIVGARVMVLKGQPGAMSSASIVADLFVQVVTQLIYTFAGLAALALLGTGGSLLTTAAGGVVIAVPLLAGFYLIQHRRAGDMVMAALKRLAGDRTWTMVAATDAFYRDLERIYRGWRSLFASGAIHLLGWLTGTLEVYVALHLMGHPIGLAEALVIESLTQALRGAAFAVPGAIGVQEGGLVVLCALFGIPAGDAIALSLVKRAADIIIGIPGLIAWQVAEGRRALKGAETRR